MKPERLPARLRVQLELALLGDCGCATTIARLEREARSSGLTGAEIDAALAGRSFDATAAAVLAFACALKSEAAGQIENARRRAQDVGITDRELMAVARKVEQTLASRRR